MFYIRFIIFIAFVICFSFSCKTEDETIVNSQNKLSLNHVLIRKINLSEYTNNNSVTEMILLYNNSLAAYVQDTIEGTELIPERRKKINYLSSLSRFSQIDSSSLVKRSVEYSIKNDTLLLYYLPEGDKSMFFKSIFKPKSGVFSSKLYALRYGEIHNTIDIIENTDQVYKFNVVTYN